MDAEKVMQVRSIFRQVTGDKLVIQTLAIKIENRIEYRIEIGIEA